MNRNSYTVTVENRSPRHEQSYVIFSQPPQITGLVQGRIWPVVITRTNVTASQMGTFKIMSNYYQAFCGQAQKRLTQGVDPVAKHHRAVSLGEKKMNDTRIPGTTLNMSMSKRKEPEFPRVTPTPSAGAGAFEIVTGSDFTSEDALDEQWLIGYGVYPKAIPRASPAACFIPHPDTKYQIKPSHTYYVACGAFEAGSIIDPDKITAICKVDFDSLKTGASTVSVVHDENDTMWVR